MAAVVADRVWRESTPGGIETDLAAVWREVGDTGPLARAMMSNLIVFRHTRADDADRTPGAAPFGGLPVDEVAARHPCRVLIIDHESSDDFVGMTSAAVGVVTYGPPQARYGVEQIAVRSASRDASLPSIVRRLVRGDLPTSVWCPDDLSRTSPVDEIVAMGRQLVFDSARWRDFRAGLLALAPYIAGSDRDAGAAAGPIPPPTAGGRTADARTRRIDLADVNWRRLAPMRRAIVFAARASRRTSWQPSDVRITHQPGAEALAWLLAGWIASRLDWPAEAPLGVQEAQHGDALLSVEIGEGGADFTTTLERGRVVVSPLGGLGSVVRAPEEDEADAVAAELHSLVHDICLHDALSALRRSFHAA